MTSSGNIIIKEIHFAFFIKEYFIKICFFNSNNTSHIYTPYMLFFVAAPFSFIQDLQLDIGTLTTKEG